MPVAKRKADGVSATSTKKARKGLDYSEAKALVEDLVSGDGTAEVTSSEARALALYARWLEEEIAASKPKEMSPQELGAAAEKLRHATVSGIKKQMKWKPTCKKGSAKWSHDGVCTDPVVFGALLGLDAPPKWKTHKYTVEEFEDLMGSISTSAMYDNLVLCGNVNVRYQQDEGTFKISGSYGAPRHM